MVLIEDERKEQFVQSNIIKQLVVNKYGLSLKNEVLIEHFGTDFLLAREALYSKYMKDQRDLHSKTTIPYLKEFDPEDFVEEEEETEEENIEEDEEVDE